MEEVAVTVAVQNVLTVVNQIVNLVVCRFGAIQVLVVKADVQKMELLVIVPAVAEVLVIVVDLVVETVV